jgi:LysM repeat protein
VTKPAAVAAMAAVLAQQVPMPVVEPATGRLMPAEAAHLMRPGPAPADPGRTVIVAGQWPKTITVKNGDTLEHIAEGMYGSKWARDWYGIWKNNRKVIGGDPDLIFAGERLVISSPQDAQPAPASAERMAATPQAQVSSDQQLPDLNGSETSWIDEFLDKVGAPHTPADVDFMFQWIRQETTWNYAAPDGALLTNNPLNTEYHGPGSAGSANSAGVADYGNEQDGLDAEVHVLLTNAGYDDVVRALRAGDGLCGDFAGLALWSDDGYASACPAV